LHRGCIKPCRWRSTKDLSLSLSLSLSQTKGRRTPEGLGWLGIWWVWGKHASKAWAMAVEAVDLEEEESSLLWSRVLGPKEPCGSQVWFFSSSWLLLRLPNLRQLFMFAVEDLSLNMLQIPEEDCNLLSFGVFGILLLSFFFSRVGVFCLLLFLFGYLCFLDPRSLLTYYIIRSSLDANFRSTAIANARRSKLSVLITTLEEERFLPFHVASSICNDRIQ
jgi:hypothetical protein